MTGATQDTRPSSEDCCGARIATTPVGSGREKLKKGPETALEPPSTWAILSAQPAYQTSRSTVASTSVEALRALRPSAAATSSTNWARRPSSSSATR